MSVNATTSLEVSVGKGQGSPVGPASKPQTSTNVMDATRTLKTFAGLDG